MTTKQTTSTSTSLVDIIGAIAVISFIILASTNTFAQHLQKTQKVSEDVVEPLNLVESFVTFRYDNIENYNDAPAVVPTKEQLKDNEIDRKMIKYAPQGLPSMEDVIKQNILEEIMNGTGFVESNTNEVIMPIIAHLTKDDTKTTACLHLMKDDTWC